MRTLVRLVSRTMVGMTGRTKVKTTLSLETAPIIRQRASEAGMDMSAWVDDLVRHADLGLRIEADAATIRAAGLDGPDRAERNARIAATIRVGR